MIKFNYDSRAERELEQAIDYYQERSRLAASNFLRDYENSLNCILRYPEGAPIKDKMVRARSLSHFPFTIHYIYHDNIVYIVGLAHQSRHPDYWKDRLKHTRFK